MLSVLTLIAASFAADCPEPLTEDALSQRLERAVASYRALDSDGFFISMASVSADLPCLDLALPPTQVAQLHRLMGVTEFSRNGTLPALAWFHAANRVDPDGTLPEDLVPEGHELWQLAAQVGRGETMRLPPIARGTRLFIDGIETRDRPLNEPILVQLMSDTHSASTAYLAPEEAFPPYPLSRAPAVRRTAIATSAGVLAATALTTYVMALAQGAPIRSREVPDTWTRDDVLDRQQQVNTLTGVSVTTAIVSIGLGATAIAL